MRHCQHCHTCGTRLQRVLDGEEWCPTCGAYRRYKSHGWGASGEGEWDCPAQPGAFKSGDLAGSGGAAMTYDESRSALIAQIARAQRAEAILAAHLGELRHAADEPATRTRRAFIERQWSKYFPTFDPKWDAAQIRAWGDTLLDLMQMWIDAAKPVSTSAAARVEHLYHPKDYQEA